MINFEDQDLEFEELTKAMEDGLEDTWINLPTRTISKYVSYKLLEELETIEQKLKNPNSPGIDKILDSSILRLVEQVRSNEARS